ncbi:MAG: hypothetical protein Q9170_002912 [Blastenia crenularia]
MSQTKDISSEPVKACIFDLDGLLLDSEDIYTDIFNDLLKPYTSTPLPWTVKARQQSRGEDGYEDLLHWVLHQDTVPYFKSKVVKQENRFEACRPLPGVLRLLYNLKNARNIFRGARDIELAIASSTSRRLFGKKTKYNLGLKSFFPTDCCVLANHLDEKKLKEKPAPDIFLEALRCINEEHLLRPKDLTLPLEIKPADCLVFEDSISGVAAARAAGMRVCWVPHPGLRRVCKGMEQLVLAGRMKEVNEKLSGMTKDAMPAEGRWLKNVRTKWVKWDLPNETSSNAQELRAKDQKYESIMSEDGWAEMLGSLKHFDYGKYGILGTKHAMR